MSAGSEKPPGKGYGPARNVVAANRLVPHQPGRLVLHLALKDHAVYAGVRTDEVKAMRHGG